jgi:hypothetical protein
MNNKMMKVRLLCLKASAIFMFAMVAIGASAQDTTITTIRNGVPSYETRVKNAEVVYVSGNDLVLKVENGKVEHLMVPDSDKFMIDGKEVTVHELMPGTKISQTITTSTTPRYVNSVRVLKGKVWHVNAPKSVILSMPDGPNQVYEVPSHAKFVVNGKQKTVFDLRKGNIFTATIVSDDTHSVTEETKAVVGQGPMPALPQEVGALLFFHPVLRAPSPVLVASLEQPATTLPNTGTLLPLAGLLGSLAVASSLGLGAARRAFVKD